MPDEDQIRSEVREAFKKPENSARNMVIILILLFIAVVAIIYLQFFAAPSVAPEDVAYVSDADLGIQGEIQNITGYNWSSFIKAGSNAGLAGMLLLASEVSVLDDQFVYLNKSAGINNSEWAGINLVRLDVSDTGKSGLLKLINNTKAIQQFYLSKGLSSSETRLNRLDFLYAYFERNGMPEGDVPADAQFLSGDLLGMSAESYGQMLVLMMVRHNALV